MGRVKAQQASRIRAPARFAVTGKTGFVGPWSPFARAYTPEDVDEAETVVWLVDGARTVTGELILLDLGMHLGGKVTVPGKA